MSMQGFCSIVLFLVPGLMPRPFFVPAAAQQPAARSLYNIPAGIRNPKRKRLARGTFVRFARIIRPPVGQTVATVVKRLFQNHRNGSDLEPVTRVILLRPIQGSTRGGARRSRSPSRGKSPEGISPRIVTDS